MGVHSVEYNVSYIYHALYAYFDRDNVALPGLAEYFKHQSEEEREHAEKCMEYQNKRGGRVKLQPLASPETEYLNAKKVIQQGAGYVLKLRREMHCTRWNWCCRLRS